MTDQWQSIAEWICIYLTLTLTLKQTCALAPHSPLGSGYAEVGVRLVAIPSPSLRKVVIQQSSSLLGS